jgi:hypothetical protein
MNRIINCTFENCGSGIYLGEGTQAYIDGCEAIGCGVGYTFHENANISMNRSSAIRNNIGVDIIKANHATFEKRGIPQGIRFNSSYEIAYAVSYLINVRGYNPYTD